MGLPVAVRWITSITTKTAEQQIFLCFNEWSTHNHIEEQGKRGNSNTEIKVVRSFKIHDDDDIDDRRQPEELTLVASNATEETRKLNPWVRYGDKILHNHGCNGRSISWLDTSKLHPRFEHSSRKTRIKSFSDSKSLLTWGEIDGKLYCIDYEGDREYVSRFQVLNSEKNCEWKSLNTPLYLLGNCQYCIPHQVTAHRALFLDGGKYSKYIIGWHRDLPATFCWNASYPCWLPSDCNVFEQDYGWNQLSYDLRSHGGRPFVIKHQDHAVFGNFYLFFDYNPFAENRLQIRLFCMSENCESFQAINNSNIELPILCHNYLPVYPRFDEPRIADDINSFPPSNLGLDYVKNPRNSALHLMYSRHSFPVFEFVNLGDQRFGFILHKHRYYDPSYWPDNKAQEGEPAGVLFLTYKYDIVVVNNAMEIRAMKTGCRYFCYRSQVPSSDGIFMMGAFLI